MTAPEPSDGPADAAPYLLGLRLQGRRVLVVGGGGVALRRVAGLLEAGADVLVVAPEVLPAVDDLAARGRLVWEPRPYRDGDVDGAWLVLACTDDPQVNAAVLDAATARRVWCVRADDADAATAWTPATGRGGPAVVGVLGGRDPGRAAALRDAAVRGVEEALASGAAPATRGGPRRGRVVLVGGGPGDPGLLTRRGHDRLAEADVVLVDRLAPLAALDRLRADVEVVDVAKVPRGRSTGQEAINALLVEHARAGRTVVRLKGGDPFVLGRGMEEVQACVAAGVEVEVVPGVTSAVAVPALVGVPVTHRGAAQGFCVVSGHLAPGHPDSQVDWGGLAVSGLTIVCLMAVKTLGEIASALVESGLAADTPVVVVQDGGLPGQRVLRAPLSAAGDMMVREQVTSPAVVVIGAVAGLAGRAGTGEDQR